MPAPIADLGELLQNLEPRLQPGAYVFVSVAPDGDLAVLEPRAAAHRSSR